MESSQHFLSEQQLIEALQAGPCQGSGWLLGVDGEQGTGKSALATRLAQRLGSTVVSCDDFISNGRLSYPRALDLAALTGRVASAQAHGAPIIIESVILRLILQAIDARPSASIYVRHSWPIGTFTHPHLFDASLLSQAIHKDEQIGREFFPDEPGLVGEILKYHKEYQPHATSTYLLDHGFSRGS